MSSSRLTGMMAATLLAATVGAATAFAQEQTGTLYVTVTMRGAAEDADWQSRASFERKLDVKLRVAGTFSHVNSLNAAQSAGPSVNLPTLQQLLAQCRGNAQCEAAIRSAVPPEVLQQAGGAVRPSGAAPDFQRYTLWVPDPLNCLIGGTVAITEKETATYGDEAGGNVKTRNRNANVNGTVESLVAGTCPSGLAILLVQDNRSSKYWLEIPLYNEIFVNQTSAGKTEKQALRLFGSDSDKGKLMFHAIDGTNAGEHELKAHFTVNAGVARVEVPMDVVVSWRLEPAR